MHFGDDSLRKFYRAPMRRGALHVISIPISGSYLPLKFSEKILQRKATQRLGQLIFLAQWR